MINTEIANLPADAQLDIEGVASVLGKSVRTIRRWLARGELPLPVRYHGRDIWLAGTLQKWFRKRQEAAEAEFERLQKLQAKAAGMARWN